MLRRVKAALRRAIFNARVLRNYLYDYHRYVMFTAGIGGKNTRQQQAALITRLYHSIEKGLALKACRPGFGRAKVDSLISALRAYLVEFGLDHTTQIAYDVLNAYATFNSSHGSAELTVITALQELTQLGVGCRSGRGGVRLVTRAEILRDARIEFNAFLNARHSVRDFEAAPIDRATIERAVAQAQRSPSVCNRQSCKVYAFDNDAAGRAVLDTQNGNRGFGEQADKILIVTSDLQCFQSPGERNQCWVDGGLFAMTLVYALHGLGLGTCCLNWAVEHQTDQQLRKLAAIPTSEAIIVLMAVGNLREKFSVAMSVRKPLEEVLVYRGATSIDASIGEEHPL